MGLINYIKETRAELKHVNWPSRKQAAGFTMLVVVSSAAVAVYLGFFDYILTLVLDRIVL